MGLRPPWPDLACAMKIRGKISGTITRKAETAKGEFAGIHAEVSISFLADNTEAIQTVLDLFTLHGQRVRVEIEKEG